LGSPGTSPLVGLSAPLKFDGQLILGSGSPRRKELLEALGIPFDIRRADTDELAPDGLSDVETVAYVAKEKAEALVGELLPGEVVLTADTEVWMHGHRFGKPKDMDHAKAMLAKLCGRTHKVITAVCATDGTIWREAQAIAEVTLDNLPSQWIDYYVETYKPLDKAGAYGAQEWIGQLVIRRMEGTFDNVKGLPLPEVVEVLRPWLKG